METRGDKKTSRNTEDFYECQEGSSEHDDLFHAAQEQAWLKCTKVPGPDKQQPVFLYMGVSLNGGFPPHFTSQVLIMFSRKTHDVLLKCFLTNMYLMSDEPKRIAENPWGYSYHV